MAIGPLAMPGGNPARVSTAPKPLIAGPPTATGYKLPKMTRPNRRAGARKTNRMAFTPPQKLTAFKDSEGE